MVVGWGRARRSQAVIRLVTVNAALAEDHASNCGPSNGSYQAWETDITYVPTQEGWLYLVVLKEYGMTLSMSRKGKL